MNAPAQAGLPALPLKDLKLFREQCYVDGEWLDASSKKFIDVKTIRLAGPQNPNRGLSMLTFGPVG